LKTTLENPTTTTAHANDQAVLKKKDTTQFEGGTASSTKPAQFNPSNYSGTTKKAAIPTKPSCTF
jgi:hypothetical protein